MMLSCPLSQLGRIGLGISSHPIAPDVKDEKSGERQSSSFLHLPPQPSFSQPLVLLPMVSQLEVLIQVLSGQTGCVFVFKGDPE